jgi:hypothetical protein
VAFIMVNFQSCREKYTPKCLYRFNHLLLLATTLADALHKTGLPFLAALPSFVFLFLACIRIRATPSYFNGIGRTHIFLGA